MIQFYRAKKRTIQISFLRPDYEKDLEELYVQPKLTIVRVAETIKEAKDMKGKEVMNYKDLFKIGHSRNIYIQGNPGMGKSTYGTKMTLDWCDCMSVEDSQEIQQKQALFGLEFDFLFLISLRDSTDKKCDVLQMVKESIINQLSFQKIFSDGFVSGVLDNERCLIILDGLDEWTHPKNGFCEKEEEQKRIPHRPGGGKCVYLTLTRPWKLSHVCLKDSEVDILLEISGVRRPEELISKVISSLNSREEKSRNVRRFTSDTRHLSQLKTIPVISMQLVSIWYESERVPASQSGIYCAMIRMMLDRTVDRTSSEESSTDGLPKCFDSLKWYKSEIDFLKHIGKLAFETLFPEDGNPSQVVFTDDIVRSHLEDEIKITALRVGLVTEYKIRSLNQDQSHLYFLHKTFQEFLAALYLFLHTEQNKALVSRVERRGEYINDISQMLIFLCGMAPALAIEFSHMLMSATTSSLKKKRKGNVVKDITEIMNTGYTECVQNGKADIWLSLTHVYYGREMSKVYQPCIELLRRNTQKIETIWCDNDEFYHDALNISKVCFETITTLHLPFIDENLEVSKCSSLQALLINGEEKSPVLQLDLSICEQLEFLKITQGNLSMIIDTDQLQWCKLYYCDLSRSNIIETLTGRNTKLRKLVLHWCKFRERRTIKSFHLDLTSCSSLESLSVLGKDISRKLCDVSVSINTTNLRHCEMLFLDLSQGNLLEAFNNCSQLSRLGLWYCIFPMTDGRHNKKVLQDVSACTKLKRITVQESGVIIRYNNHFVGGEQEHWNKVI